MAQEHTEEQREAIARGFCIHRIRTAIADRRATRDAMARRLLRMQAQLAVAHLRELGPGEVGMPEGSFGEPVEWFGCDSCDGSGEREFNEDGADVMGFCSWCPKGVAAERRYLRWQGLGHYAKHSTLDAPPPRRVVLLAAEVRP